MGPCPENEIEYNVKILLSQCETCEIRETATNICLPAFSHLRLEMDSLGNPVTGPTKSHQWDHYGAEIVVKVIVALLLLSGIIHLIRAPGVPSNKDRLL